MPTANQLTGPRQHGRQHRITAATERARLGTGLAPPDDLVCVECDPDGRHEREGDERRYATAIGHNNAQATAATSGRGRLRETRNRSATYENR